jgi:hypothetical protein
MQKSFKNSDIQPFFGDAESGKKIKLKVYKWQQFEKKVTQSRGKSFNNTHRQERRHSQAV